MALQSTRVTLVPDNAGLLMAAAAAFACVGCVTPHAAHSQPAPAEEPRRVIIVSFDGLRPDAIDAASATTLQRLIAGGSYDPDCRNEFPPSTLPNHASMVTGKPVCDHRVFLNIELDGYIDSTTIFELATRAGRRAAFFAGKNKLGYLCRPESVAVRVIDDNMDIMADAVIAAFASRPPDLSFIHFRHPDGAGHQFGWMSDEYLEHTRQVDKLLERIMKGISDAGVDDATFIITSDHGGQGKAHFLDTPAERNVPFIMYGPGIAAGRVIGVQMHVRDVAPIAAVLLGLEVPDSWRSAFPEEVRTPPPATQQGESKSAAPGKCGRGAAGAGLTSLVAMTPAQSGRRRSRRRMARSGVAWRRRT